MLDAYSPCPCGSGKKFKWCCQPIHGAIEQALKLDDEGQHEAATRALQQVTLDHPSNPEAYGRLAQMHFAADRIEEAEKALQKALDINPDYPYGHFLRAQFRLYEGEIPGGLMLLRKAAALYDPAAKEMLAQVYEQIFQSEMRLNHPVAAHAAAALAYRYHPVPELRQGIDSVFGDKNPNLPLAARQEYKLQALPAGAPPQSRAAWEQALGQAATGKLTDAVAAFKQLTGADENNTAAWYNLAITEAWSGDNPGALEALERYVALENDETKAAQAWALAEVLKCGQGLEDQADFVEHSVVFALRDPNQFVQALETLAKDGVVGGLAVNEERTALTGVVIDKPPPALTPELEAKQLPRVGAFFVLAGALLRLWNTSQENVERAAQMVKPHLGPIAQELTPRGPARFTDLFTETLIFIDKSLTPEARQTAFRNNLEQFFEGAWFHRPRKSLGGTPPIDAVGHPQMRKKVRGIVDFLQQCAALGQLPYDFDRLRRKLNLLEGGAAPSAAQQLDISALGAAELAALDRSALPDEQLEQAYQTAVKLDARELAGQFAQALVQRPARADKPDRYAWFNFLITQALGGGDGGAALDWVNDGEKHDCEHNQGRRRNDYELRRGQVLAKNGDFGQAAATFDSLIQRSPDELRFYGAATEALLSARQGPVALTFADQGLAQARKQNNRDQESYFQELADAAKRQS